MTIPFNQCVQCENLVSGTQTCKAFPNGIPDEIWEAKKDHSKAYKGDNGVRFKNRKPS